MTNKLTLVSQRLGLRRVPLWLEFPTQQGKMTAQDADAVPMVIDARTLGVVQSNAKLLCSRLRAWGPGTNSHEVTWNDRSQDPRKRQDATRKKGNTSTKCKHPHCRLPACLRRKRSQNQGWGHALTPTAIGSRHDHPRRTAPSRQQCTTFGVTGLLNQTRSVGVDKACRGVLNPS